MAQKSTCEELEQRVRELEKAQLEHQIEKQVLQEQVLHYKVLMDQSLDGIAIIDQKHRVVESNKRFAEMLGYTTEEVARLHTWDWEAIATEAEIRSNFADLTKTKTTFETRHRRKDGTIYDAEVTACGAKLGDEAVVLTITRDITERKRTEEALKQEKDLLRRVVETSPSGITIVNDQGQITFANSQAEKVLGLAKKTITDRSYNQPAWRITDYDGNPFPDERLPFRLVMTTGQSVHDVRHAIEWPDGRKIFLSINAAPFFARSGTVSGMMATIEDITEHERALAALQESEQQFRKLYEESPIGMELYSSEGQLLNVNSACLDIFGVIDPDEIKGFNLFNDPNIPDEYKKKLRKGGGVRYEVQFDPEKIKESQAYQTTKSGIIHLDVQITRLGSNAKGAPGGYLVQIVDITARKQAEDNLSRANTRLEALWNVSSLDGSDLQTVSNHVLESIVKMTQSAYGFYGFVNGDETGMTIHSWTGKAMENCSIENKPSYFPICEAGVWGEAIRRRVPFILNDYCAMHPAKKGLPQGHVQLTKILVVPFLSKNRITSVAAVANRTTDYNQDDITQITSFLFSIQAIVNSKQAEERLRESEAFLDATAKIAKIGGWELDAQTLEVTWTKETYLIHDVPLDYKPSLQDAITFFHPEDRDKLTSAIQRSLENGEPYDLEIRFITARGNQLWTRTVCQPYIVNGEVITLKGIFQDISQRKRAEEEKEKLQAQLTQSQKLESIGTLAGGIAHDFNNILSPIMLHSEMAMMDLPADSPVHNSLKQIYKSGERARDLVKQILTFARKTKEERIPIKASSIVKEAVKFLRSTIPTTIDIRYECRTGLDIVLADPTQLSQIVMNLCTNAAHAMEEKGGSIEVILENETLEPDVSEQIIVSEPGCYLKLTVKDTGHGIEPGLLGKIFEPYFTTKAVGKGTGMGLALVHGIVKSYGGEITVQSDVGTGTCFCVYLQLVEGAGDVAETMADAAQFPGGTEKILFIDDELSAVNAMKPVLEKLGYEVTARTSSIEALELFREKPDRFDIIITDQTMPKMTGKELAGEILFIRPNMPIILCTGFSEQIDESVAKEIGILGFVMKPLVMRQIANKIREILDQKRSYNSAQQ